VSKSAKVVLAYGFAAPYYYDYATPYGYSDDSAYRMTLPSPMIVAAAMGSCGVSTAAFGSANDLIG
jgi:hypothetical protein